MLIHTLKGSKNLGTPSSGEHMMEVRKDGRRIDMFGFRKKKEKKRIGMLPSQGQDLFLFG
jgi:hypothetical protein